MRRKTYRYNALPGVKWDRPFENLLRIKLGITILFECIFKIPGKSCRRAVELSHQEI